MEKKNSTPSSFKRLNKIIGVLIRRGAITGFTPEKVRLILEDLGPTFVKLGQIMSMRRDILPDEYCKELQKLRTDVKPMPKEEVIRVLEASLKQPVENVFPSFDFEPLGSASVAQVHRAKLPDGTPVVLKVQREGIRETMESDITLLKKAFKILKIAPIAKTIDIGMVLDEMWNASQDELDFTIEANNVATFEKFNSNITYVYSPRVYTEYSTEHVLVMEEIDGIRIDDVDTLVKAGYEPEEIVDKLLVNYLKQILDDGFFHADPHPGNIFIRDGKIVWLDWGMIGRISDRDRKLFKKALKAIMERDTDAVVSVVLTLGICAHSIDKKILRIDVDELLDDVMKMDLAAINLGEVLQRVMELSQKHKIVLPSSITMLGRGILTIEGTAEDIYPDISVMNILASRYATKALKDLNYKELAMEDLQALFESSRKTIRLPSLLADFLLSANSGKLHFKVENTPNKQMVLEKRALNNRARRTAAICTGILSSTLLTFTPTDVHWFGLPPISFLGFMFTGIYGIISFFAYRRK